MQRVMLIGTGAYALVNAAYMGVVTQHWYNSIPGVAQTGPLNLHFARDVALAFLASGLALIWAGRQCDRSTAFCGAAWLIFHALFHIWIWVHRGWPADLIALTNLAGIQLPAFIALWAALNLRATEVAR